MPDGQLRRPPQLWEQRLSRTTSILGVGISSSGDTTAIVPPTPPPGAGGGTEPAPVAPPVGVFKKPSTPQLVGGLQGINVLWDGRNADGDLWPYDTSFVEVHMDTSGTAFTPGTATLKGRLARPGALFVGGLTAGTTYHFRLRGADPAGNYTDPSDAASGLTGLTTASDYGTATIGTGSVSFDARQIGGVTSTVGTATPTNPVIGDIWLDTTGGATTHKRWNGTSWETILFGSGSIANNAITEVKIDNAAITAAKLAGSAVTETKIAADAVTSPKIVAGAVVATKIAAGAVETDKLAANAVTAAKIAANTITASQIAANTITASQIAANTITASQIAASTITGTQIAAGAIAAGAIAANAVTTEKINAGAVTAAKIAALSITANEIASNAITADKINANAVTAAKIEATALDGKTITGSTIRTASSGNRVTIDGISEKDRVIWYNSSNTRFTIYISGDNLIMDQTTSGVFRVSPDIELDKALVDTSTSVPNLRINTTTGVVKQTTHANSSQRFKHDIIPLDDTAFGGDVDEQLLGDPLTQAVDPADILNLTPIQYRRNEAPDVIVTGFLAEDVEQKFPTAATYDDDGLLETIDARAIVAALLAVVKDQQATITDLRTRIEALEA